MSVLSARSGLVAVKLLVLAAIICLGTASDYGDSRRFAMLPQPTVADDQHSPGGAELRLAARANTDGTISVGVQWRSDGRWRGTTPRLSRLPRDAAEGSWYASSSVPVPMARVEAEILAESPRWYRELDQRALILSAGEREWRIDESLRLTVRLEGGTLSMETHETETSETSQLAGEIGHEPTGEGNQLVRVLGRRVAGDAVELGLQRLLIQEWQPIEGPGQAIVTLARDGQWVFTEPFTTPRMPPVFRGELRSGATIETVDGGIQVTVDGQTKSARCGVLGFSTSNTIEVFTRSEDCQRHETLFSICSEDTPDGHCDNQQFHVYGWEHRHTGPVQIELTDAEMATIVQAVYGDYIVGKRPPAIARSEYVGSSYWSSGDHTVYMMDSHRRLKVLLHETAHAIVDGLGRPGPGHGPSFAAVNLSVFERYAPLVDTRAMREDAERLGVSVADWTPHPVSDDGIDVVRRVICDLGEGGQALCDAFDAQATSISSHELQGRGPESGRLDDLYWSTGALPERGSLLSTVTKERSVNLGDGEPARLRMTCSDDHGPQVEIWWPGVVPLSGAIEYQIGSLGWVGQRWNARQTSWGESEQQVLSTYAPRRLAAQLGWAASAGLPWSIRLRDARETHELTIELGQLFATPVQEHLALCLLEPESGSEPFVGSGALPGGRYSARLDDAGLLYSRVYVDAQLTSHPGMVARLHVSCETDDSLNVRVWWRGLEGVGSSVEYGIGDWPIERARWHVGSGTWGEDQAWTSLRAPDSLRLVNLLAWRGAAGQQLYVSVQADGETFSVALPLEHLFETPVQGNLSRCGAGVERPDPDAPVVDHGQLGEDFWWGVVEEEDQLRTYVTTQTTIVDEGDRVSRMQINCAENALQLSVYWDLDQDLDRTVRLIFSDGSATRTEWNTWTSTWHDGQFKGIGAQAEDAVALIRRLAWAAQSSGSFTVEVHERGKPNRRYSATFDLDGLFETPVQPNLARCGR